MVGKPKAVPTTCAQLADANNFITDVANPEVKALKTKCDSEKGAPATGARPMTSEKSKTR